MSTTTITPIAERSAPRTTIGRSPWAALPVILSGAFMVVLDFFIVNVAMPSMQTDLHASNGALEWVAAGYGLTTAIFLITAGRAGDRIGRRKTFSIGLAVFTLSSLACGAASTSEVLIVGRLFQGVGGALLMTNLLTLIGVMFEGADRTKALSAYGMTLGLAAVSGQLIGGILVQANVAGLGWRSCFLINVPIGLLALAAAPRLVAESRVKGAATGIDLVGTVLVTVGLTAVLLPLVEGRQHGWPVWTWISLGLAPVILGAFVVHQRRLRDRGGAPLLDLSLFRQRTFSAGLAAQLVFWCGQASFFLVLALYLQQGRGLSALDAGLVFTILAAAYLVASAIAPGLLERHGRRLLAEGALVLAVGHGLLILTVADIGTGGSVAVLAPALLLIGAGMGIVIAPLVTLILSTTGPEQAGAASGVLSTFQNVGNALGVAIVGVIYFGAVHSGAAGAFQLSLVALAAILVGVAALTRLLPTPAGAPRRSAS